MSQISIPVNQFEFDYICDKCGTGAMRPIGIALLSSPPQYPHICSNRECKSEKTFMVKYPYIGYVK